MGRRVRVSRSLTLFSALVVSLLGSAAVSLPANAAAAGPGGGADVSVPVSAMPGRDSALPSMEPEKSKPVVWPTAGSTVVDLPESRTRSLTETEEVSATVAGLPVRVKGVAPVVDDLSKGTASVDLPSQVRVEVLARNDVAAAGYPLALKVSRTDGRTSGRIAIDLDYSAFRHAYGADWDSRLQLVALRACPPSTPENRGCQPAVPLVTDNDHKAGVLTAEVDLDGTQPAALPMGEVSETGGQGGGAAVEQSGTVVALMAAAGSQTAADFAQTSLKSTGSWQAGSSGGAFAWSYPMQVPPVPSDLEPDVTLGYSSGAVDGQTAGTNTQVAWGEGWDYTPGFIERSYRSCAEDTANSPYWTQFTGNDLCWRLPNAHMVLGGQSVELVLGSDGVWRSESDDKARVELLTGGTSTGYWNSEKWRVTTTDGTQYYFGMNRLQGWQTGDRETGSVLGVPVYANHTGEPCFTTNPQYWLSGCDMAYRWNLDYVRREALAIVWR